MKNELRQGRLVHIAATENLARARAHLVVLLAVVGVVCCHPPSSPATDAVALLGSAGGTEAAAEESSELGRGAVSGSEDAGHADATLPPASPARLTVSTSLEEATIYARASRGSNTVGYFRSGERVEIRDGGATLSGCPGGWVETLPVGFVCVGRDGVRRDEPAGTPGRTDEPNGRRIATWGEYRGTRLFRATKGDGGESLFVAGNVPRGTRLAFSSEDSTASNDYIETADGFRVPAADVRFEHPSEFHGVELKDAAPPSALVWARASATPLYRFDGKSVAPQGTSLASHAYEEATGRSFRIAGELYYALREGGETTEDGGVSSVRASDVAFVDLSVRPPKGVAEDEVWIDVVVHEQSLVVYRGARPLYATLISTGKGGAAHYTPRGTFHVQHKHRSSVMLAAPRPEIGEEGYRFDEVPFVQYIVGGIALHGVYWHDDFGLPRSHGCVNLSLTDAAWVFDHTSPSLPPGWHGVSASGSTGPGTTVVIR